MTTYRKTIYHIVFATRNREPSLLDEHRVELFKFIWGICKNLDCHLYRIGGYREHVHLCTDIHPTLALSEFVRRIKTSSSRWIKSGHLFPGFTHWQEGYAAFTLSIHELERVVAYIKQQEDHHRKRTFLEEYETMLNEMGLSLNVDHLP